MDRPIDMPNSTVTFSSRHVPAGDGVAWWRSAWELFMRAPLMWIVFAVITIGGAFAVSLVPLLGSLVVAFALPALIGGWMLAARKAEQGGAVEVGDLFSAFKQERRNDLFVLGGLSLAIGLVFGLLLVAMMGLGAFTAGTIGATVDGTGGVLAMLGAASGALMLALIGGVLMSMVFWFSPALVLFKNVSAIDAVKLSFAANVKNIGAFLVCGIVYLLAAFVASLLLGLGWIVLIPVTVLVLYVSYQRVFD
jgi:uncharacterized membrane protein